MQRSLDLSLTRLAPPNCRWMPQGFAQMKTGVKGRATRSFFDSTFNVYEACTGDLKALEEAHVLQ